MLFAFCHGCKVLSIPGGCAQHSRIYLYSVKIWGEKLIFLLLFFTGVESLGKMAFWAKVLES